MIVMSSFIIGYLMVSTRPTAPPQPQGSFRRAHALAPPRARRDYSQRSASSTRHSGPRGSCDGVLHWGGLCVCVYVWGGAGGEAWGAWPRWPASCATLGPTSVGVISALDRTESGRRPLWPSRTKRGKTTAVIDCDEHTTRSSSRPYYNACRKRQPSPIVHPISPPKK
jgi:hypothetical protein